MLSFLSPSNQCCTDLCTYVLHAGFSINGVILSDSFSDPIAFSQFDLTVGLVPAVTLGPEQEVKFNFGKNEVSE